MKRQVAVRARRVLVTLGGSDPAGATPRVLQALSAIPDRELELRVIIGPAFAQQAHGEREALLGRFVGRSEILQGVDDLAPWLLWADLAITGGGLTKYEASLLGTPVLTIAQGEAEAVHASSFEKAGSSVYLGQAQALREETIREAFVQLAHDGHARERMARCGRAIADGRGCDRLLDALDEDVGQGARAAQGSLSGNL